MKPARYLIAYLIPFGVVVGYFQGGLYLLLAPFIVFGVIPLLDLIFGINTHNPDEAEEQALLADNRYRLLTMAAAPIQVALVFWGGWVFVHGSLVWWEKLLFAYSLGISSGGMGINISHELVHKVNDKWEPFLGRVMLWTVFYTHWAIEHVVGHHRNVATYGDPATSRFGESFWQFLPRTVIGGFESAWNIEADRLEKKGANKYGPQNRILRYLAAQAALVAFFGWWLGAAGILFLVIQAAIAIGLLELVNYLEHYGLVREQREDGSYEPVKPAHSWNSSNWLTNYFLFNLQRHSDHHYRASRRYQILRHFDEAPQLPTGYAGMVVMAFFPPLWRRVMDHRVPARPETL